MGLCIGFDVNKEEARLIENPVATLCTYDRAWLGVVDRKLCLITISSRIVICFLESYTNQSWRFDMSIFYCPFMYFYESQLVYMCENGGDSQVNTTQCVNISNDGMQYKLWKTNHSSGMSCMRFIPFIPSLAPVDCESEKNDLNNDRSVASDREIIHQFIKIFMLLDISCKELLTSVLFYFTF